MRNNHSLANSDDLIQIEMKQNIQAICDTQKSLNLDYLPRNQYLQLFLAINFVFVLGMYLCMTYKNKINIPWFSYENKTITEDHPISVMIFFIPEVL